MMAITDFLSKDISKDSAYEALRVLRLFKECESAEEWLGIGFAAWAKLEQLQEFLEHLVEGKPLAKDTIEYMGYIANERSKSHESESE